MRRRMLVSASPMQVLRYLGRYTHRVAISNHRGHVALVDFIFTDECVSDLPKLGL